LENVVSAQIIRNLNALEEVFHSVDQAVPFNFTVFAEVSGSMHVDALRLSVARQMSRFPILRGRVDTSDGQLVWTCCDSEPRVDMVSGGTLADQLANQLNTAFAPDEPYLRVRWHRGKGVDVILLTLNHVIADGRSGIRLLQHILDDAAALIGGEPLMDPVPENTISDVPVRSVAKPLATPARQFPETDISSRNTAVLPISFDRALTGALSSKCQRLGLSLTALIGAAHALSLADVFGERVPVSMSFPVDLRGRSVAQSTSTFGLAVGNASLLYRLDAADDPWSLATRMSGDLKRAALAAEPMRIGPSSVMDLYAARSTGAISSAGRVRDWLPYPGLLVQRLGFAVSCSVVGDHILTATTYDDTLQLSYCVVGDAIPLVHAQGIASATVERLQYLAQGS